MPAADALINSGIGNAKRRIICAVFALRWIVINLRDYAGSRDDQTLWREWVRDDRPGAHDVHAAP